MVEHPGEWRWGVWSLKTCKFPMEMELRPWKLRFDVGCLCVANVDNEHGHHKLWECEDDLLELAKTMWLRAEISRIYVYTSMIIIL